MIGNTFGKLFRITTFGESHGKALGCIIDGCPANFEICEADIQIELDKRRPGQSSVTTQRNEGDKVEILSGVFEGKTTGTPITLIIFNKDQKSEDYTEIKDTFRPSHADYTYFAKYGIRDYRGGGRSSARETVARVAAGAIAKKYLMQKLGIQIFSYVEQINKIKANIDKNTVKAEDIEANIVRCPDNQAAIKMIELINKTKEEGDSLGGIICGIAKNVPVGLGYPVFDKINADLAKAIMSINAVKGFEIGSGFAGVELKGSEHNDEFVNVENKIRTKTNNAGGILGGLTNGEDIFFRVAIKPTATIKKEQQTVDSNLNAKTISPSGRHDPCVLPRAVPIIDAMTALVIMDHYLLAKIYN